MCGKKNIINGWLGHNPLDKSAYFAGWACKEKTNLVGKKDYYLLCNLLNSVLHALVI